MGRFDITLAAVANAPDTFLLTKIERNGSEKKTSFEIFSSEASAYERLGALLDEAASRGDVNASGSTVRSDIAPHSRPA